MSGRSTCAINHVDSLQSRIPTVWVHTTSWAVNFRQGNNRKHSCINKLEDSFEWANFHCSTSKHTTVHYRTLRCPWTHFWRSVASWCRINCSNFSKSKPSWSLISDVNLKFIFSIRYSSSWSPWFLHFREGKLQILSLYWNRYLRLTPAYGACILATISIIRYCGNGPLWLSFYTFTAKDCEIYWWSSLLYVQNYVNPDDVVSLDWLALTTSTSGISL